MEALHDLRRGIGTDLADRSGRSRTKDRPICEGTRIPSEVLSEGYVRHLRQMATGGAQRRFVRCSEPLMTLGRGKLLRFVSLTRPGASGGNPPGVILRRIARILNHERGYPSI